MRTIFKILLWTVIGGFVGNICATVLVQSMDRQEIVECNKLKEYSVQYAPHFYLTQWEKEMCDHHNIKINAPVEVHDVKTGKPQLYPIGVVK